MASTTKSFLCSIIILLLQLNSAVGQTKMKGVYYFSGAGLPVSAINFNYFTHIFYAFADLNPTTNQVTISSSNSASISTFAQTVRQKNPTVKPILSIGGGGANPSNFAAMAGQPNSRKSFIDSSISIARNYNFTGLDLDWEYPSSQTEMNSFGTLLTEWRAAVVKESQSTGKPRLLLSAAVFRSSDYYGTQIPVQIVSNSLDWINVMSYDFYGPGWSPNLTSPPAALFGSGGQVNADAGIRAWIQSGMPASKIAIGLPFYGWAWRLVNQNKNGFYAPANGAATGAGIYDGAISYKDIKSFVTGNGVSPVYNGTVVSNYVYSGSTWIGYDDTQSIAGKVNYAKNKGLFGYFAWQIAADDTNFTLSRTASTTWSA